MVCPKIICFAVEYGGRVGKWQGRSDWQQGGTRTGPEFWLSTLQRQWCSVKKNRDGLTNREYGDVTQPLDDGINSNRPPVALRVSRGDNLSKGRDTQSFHPPLLESVAECFSVL
jgi:hypothetical protein